MSKYCSSCGRALQEGENCFCNEVVAQEGTGIILEKASAEVTEENTQNQMEQKIVLSKTENQNWQENQVNTGENIAKPSNENNNTEGVSQEEFFSSEKAKEVIGNTSNYLKTMFDFSVNFIKNPLATIKYNAVNHDFKKGLFFGGLQSLLFSIIFVIIAAQTSRSISNIFGFGAKISYFGIFFKSLIFYATTFILLPVSFFITSKIFKLNSSFKALITIVGIASIPITMATVISVIGTLVSSYSIVLLFGASIFSIILTYIGLNETVSIDEEKIVYWNATGFTLFLVLLFVAIAIIEYNPLAFIRIF
ncbi:MAG TPA: YIP1 family protein [Clostridium sp.]|jgi:hypothetical protein|nr:YIP1 family protein [Clostridium sp.]